MRLSSELRTLKSEIRRGFTIVELLVAAALCMFIMAILSTAFSKGIDTFRILRSAGNMQEKLRMAAVVLKRDLAAQHFDGTFHPGLSGAYLTDQRLDQIGWIPPTRGYFFISNGTAGIWEGIDMDGIWSTRATDHQIAMTVKLSGNTPDQMFYALAPNLAPGNADYPSTSVFVSQWAEVRYFLVASGQNAGGTPLFILYRRQGLLVPTNATPTNGAVYPDISTTPNGVSFNSSSDVTVPGNRLVSTPIAVQPNVGDDILLSDVLSFEIKPHWTTGPASSATGVGGPSTTPTSPPAGNGSPLNWDYPFDILPVSPITGQGRTFDTWSRNLNTTVNWNDSNTTNPLNPLSCFNTGAVGQALKLPPLRIRIDAIQIKIRIWDSKAQQARQITIVQDV